MNKHRKEIFPITVFHGTVEDNSHLKNLILPVVEKTKDHKGNKVPQDWLTNNLTTSYDNEYLNAILINSEHVIGREVKRQYFRVLDQFFDDTYKVKLHNMWYNRYSNGEWQEAHTHLNSPWDVKAKPTHFSCVHFLSFNPEIHTPLTYLDPLSIIRSHSLEMKSNKHRDKFEPKVKEGDVVMFPSYLLHEVHSGAPTPDYPRVTISFNIQVLQYGI